MLGTSGGKGRAPFSRGAIIAILLVLFGILFVLGLAAGMRVLRSRGSLNYPRPPAARPAPTAR